MDTGYKAGGAFGLNSLDIWIWVAKPQAHTAKKEAETICEREY